MELKAHLSIPDSPSSCLVIVHENRGLDDHIRDVANRFARAGLAVAAPDYLSPIGGSVDDVDTNIARIKEVSREQVTDISRYWLDTLAKLTQVQNLAILGFLLGWRCSQSLRDSNSGSRKSCDVLWNGTGSIADKRYRSLVTTPLCRE